MSDSIQLMPSASAGAPQSKVSSLDTSENAASSDDVTGFTAVFASYVDPEASVTEQQIDENLTELLAALLPQDLLEAGNTLPEAEKAAMLQAFMQLQPAENMKPNTGMVAQLQGINLMDAQRKPVMNSNLLNQDYFQTLAMQTKEMGSSLTPGLPTNNITTQLAAAHFNPNTNEALLLNVSEQLVPVQAGNSSQTNALAAVGLGTATQAAATQTQMAPLNLGQNAWESNLGSRLQMLVGQNIQSAEIRLDPPELGVLDIKIKVSNDIATVNITSPHTQVREALETSVPRLREMFEESGISLGDVNVRQESFAQQQNSAEQESGSLQTVTESNEEDVVNEVTRKIVSNNMLDIYA